MLRASNSSWFIFFKVLKKDYLHDDFNYVPAKKIKVEKSHWLKDIEEIKEYSTESSQQLCLF